MKSILAQVAKRQKRITPQDEAEFIVLQMAIKAGDPLLFHSYLRAVKTSSLQHCIEIFRQEGKLLTIN
jgi:hypothetical protein